MKFQIMIAFALFCVVPLCWADLQAGAGKRMVTPDPLLPVSGGIGPSHPTTQKLHDLWVRAMVLEKNDTRVAIVGCDFLGFPKVLGYILTKVDWNSFERYNYISQVCLGEMTGEIFIEESIKFVNEYP